ncbi:hypothetical protein E3P99_04089 [Wallemia hederae]|uniref:COP9 signalosome complex subunit 2 n=1 Tax=Wallemia hederae TaxID=1540922 RepID=A0A4T0FAJ8_9BASI|nr:hypothetical protein E3P99_04089 [Wallemia hederae]
MWGDKRSQWLLLTTHNQFMMDEGEEDYDFDYEDDDDEDVEQGEAGLENKYYLAKGKKEDNLDEAISDFKSILENEEEKGDWGFKALKQRDKVTKIHFLKLRQFPQALEYYNQLLTYTKSAVTRNYSEKSINGILDYVSSDKASDQTLDLELMEKFYSVTMKTLAEMKNERLSVKTNLKLAKLWLDRREYSRLDATLKELRSSCQSADGTDDQSKGSLLLEIFALEIQMYSQTNDTKKLREIYNQTSTITSAISHPRVLGIIKECGGKMHMNEKSWEKAQTDFFESFRSYDEAGSMQRIQVLKYLVLAHMLMNSEIDPFDSQETKPYVLATKATVSLTWHCRYKENAEILPMTQLVSAYQHKEVHQAERIIAKNRKVIMEDPFISHFIDDVMRALRITYLVDLIKPYQRMELSFIAKQLNVTVDQVEDLLIELILDKKIKGSIDSVNQRLELDRDPQLEKRRYAELTNWTNEMEKMHDMLVSKLSNVSSSSNNFAGGTGRMMNPSLMTPQDV